MSIEIGVNLLLMALELIHTLETVFAPVLAGEYWTRESLRVFAVYGLTVVDQIPPSFGGEFTAWLVTVSFAIFILGVMIYLVTPNAPTTRVATYTEVASLEVTMIHEFFGSTSVYTCDASYA